MCIRDSGVAFVLVKGSRPERTVAALTELGIDRIMPLQSDRSVVRWDAKAAKLDKLHRVVREAGMQSRRVWLPQIDEVADVSEVHAVGVAGGASFLFAHPVAVDRADDLLKGALRSATETGTDTGDGATSHPATQVIVAIGPEGGWSPEEVQLAGSGLVRLPGRVLRAETAAVVAGSQLVQARDTLGARK